MDQEKIGKLIAKLRKSKGLTQSELGEMVGVGFRAVSKWENGITSPDISIINDLSKILGISADELLQGELNKNKEQSPQKKFNYKKLLYLIPIFLIIILSIIIININSNKTEVYKLEPANNSEYYIDGEIIFKEGYIIINITKLNFEKQEFKNILIQNYQYELFLNKEFIFGYGNIEVEKMLSDPVTIKNWSIDFKIKYNGNNILKNEQIEKNYLALKITFVDSKENIINKNIKIKIVEAKNK